MQTPGESNLFDFFVTINLQSAGNSADAKRKQSLCFQQKSGGFLQHFSKDIERSLLLQYDQDTDSISVEKIYDGKELAYWDETWMIYRKEKELFVENIHTHKVSKAFESDTTIHIDVSDDIVTLWDIKNAELKNSDIFILQ